jgi:hypothetical protein
VRTGVQGCACTPTCSIFVVRCDASSHVF